MKLRSVLLGCVVMLLATESARGASFVVPTDSELIAKTSTIVAGVVEGSFVQETNGIIETTYEVRVDRTMKGTLASGELVRIVSPGGIIGERGLFVPGAAHFRQGERVLVFLNRDNGRWKTTDLTLGKFRFATSTAGERVLVRDHEDITGWDQRGQVHQEKVRREAGFLRYIGERVQGRNPAPDYEVEASEITVAPPAPRRLTTSSDATLGSDAAISTEAAPFPAPTYTDWASGQPTRWPNMANGVTFRKVASQNMPGLADGGVGAIQSALGAWTNEPNSNINLIYGGTTSVGSANHDGNNVVEFNDPQNKISGSWTGAGTIGICFLSFANSHSFNGTTYWNITDADVVIQNGYSGTHNAFPAGLTHEVGHGIGWRHSNQDYATGGACNPATQECTSAAIMNSSVSGSFGYTLQTWDRNASQAVYPGSSTPTCTAPTVTSTAQRAISGGRELSVITTGTSPQSFQWYVGASGNTSTPINGATNSFVIVNPTSTTSYWVRVTNSCGSANSPTITVTASGCTPPTINGPFTRVVSGGTEISVTTTGTTPQTFQWYRGASGNTSSPVNTATLSYIVANPSVTTSYWVRVTNACGSANSAAVTVQVACVRPTINGPFTRAVSGGTEISVTTNGTTPQTFQWYRGASGNTSSPVNTATRSYLIANPSVTTSYWVRVTNACGFADSAAVTVQVACVVPTINGPFTRAVSGGTEISITTTGTTPQTFQWYRGASGNTTSPVNTATLSYLVANPAVTTSYWVRASNACGFANSAAVTIQGSGSATTSSSAGTYRREGAR
jgi:hypothetical protein